MENGESMSDASHMHNNGEGAGSSETDSDEDMSQRRVFINQPLPKDLLEEDGSPLQAFARNKIRTAKYTPLIFVPKNLWLQFHNIANIYFLFVTILAVRRLALVFVIATDSIT